MTWLLRTLSVMALAGLAAAVWFAGPLIVLVGSRPLESTGARVAIIALILALAAGIALFRFWFARRAQKALAAAIASESAYDGDGQLLETGMTKAIAALKRASGRRNFLYEVPWYLIIGPPGAGKTTALVNSGLKFPLARGRHGPAAVAGNRRHPLLRLVVHRGSGADRHRRPLHHAGFRHRKPTGRAGSPSCRCSRPITAQPADQRRHCRDQRRGPADLLATRSSTAHAVGDPQSPARTPRAAQDRFPVYALFTKADLIAGFMDEFSAALRAAPAHGLGPRPSRPSTARPEHGRRGAGGVRRARPSA
jgi:type VI secretion system protein ImpL